MREYSLRRNYGISEATYQEMLASQSGVCAICKRPPNTASGQLHVDHCHKTGAVRKLLCVKCNMALGWYEAHGDAIAAYLQR